MNSTAFILVTAVVVITAATALYSDWRAKRILRNWATNAGLEITEVSHEFSGFPQSWVVWKSQVVLRFAGIERNGTPVRGWARCGEEIGGVFFSDELEIKFN